MLRLIQADQVWEDAEGKARPVKHKDPKNEFRKNETESGIGDQELSQEVRPKKSYCCDQGSLGQLKTQRSMSPFSDNQVGWPWLWAINRREAPLIPKSISSI